MSESVERRVQVVSNESEAERVAANGRPLGRGGVSRNVRFSPSTRVGYSRTGPGRNSCFRFVRDAVRLKPDPTGFRVTGSFAMHAIALTSRGCRMTQAWLDCGCTGGHR